MRTAAILIFVAALCAGCREKVATKPVARGNEGEIIVVMNNETWAAESGDTLRAIFHAYDPNTPIEEHLFDLYQIPYADFVDQNRLHKNVIFQEINSNVEQPEIVVKKDKYAQNQLLVNVRASSQAGFVQAVSQNRDSLVNLFMLSDRNRMTAKLKRHYDEKISALLQKKYFINICVPLGYKLDEYRDGFAWCSYETARYSVNILVYEWPSSDTSALETEYLVAMRNEQLRRNVPGERAGSYMTTEMRYDYPRFELTSTNGSPTGVLRGLWRVHNDFMGGPFVSYTKIDTARQRLVSVEGFVYYPNEEVRDKIRTAESAVATFTIGD